MRYAHILWFSDDIFEKLVCCNMTHTRASLITVVFEVSFNYVRLCSTCFVYLSATTRMLHLSSTTWPKVLKLKMHDGSTQTSNQIRGSYWSYLDIFVVLNLVSIRTADARWRTLFAAVLDRSSLIFMLSIRDSPANMA